MSMTVHRLKLYIILYIATDITSFLKSKWHILSNHCIMQSRNAYGRNYDLSGTVCVWCIFLNCRSKVSSRFLVNSIISESSVLSIKHVLRMYYVTFSQQN